MRWWCRVEPCPDRLTLVVHTQYGNNQPANSKHSHEREAAVITSRGCSGVTRTSCGCGRACSLCFCLFLGLPGQAVAFGKPLTTLHAPRVLGGLCLWGIGSHTGRGWRVLWSRCGSGLFGNCLERRLRSHRVYIGFRILQSFYKVPVRFLSRVGTIFTLAHFIKAFEWITFLVSAGVRGWCCVVQIQQVGLRFRLKLDVFGRDEGGIGQGQPAPET